MSVSGLGLTCGCFTLFTLYKRKDFWCPWRQCLTGIYVYVCISSHCVPSHWIPSALQWGREFTETSSQVSSYRETAWPALQPPVQERSDYSTGAALLGATASPTSPVQIQLPEVWAPSVSQQRQAAPAARPSRLGAADGRAELGRGRHAQLEGNSQCLPWTGDSHQRSPCTTRLGPACQQSLNKTNFSPANIG